MSSYLKENWLYIVIIWLKIHNYTFTESRQEIFGCEGEHQTVWQDNRGDQQHDQRDTRQADRTCKCLKISINPYPAGTKSNLPLPSV